MNIQNLTLRGFASILACLLLTAALAVFFATRQEGIFNDYRQTARENLAASEVTQSILRARLAGLEYRFLQREDDLEAFQAALTRATEQAQSATSLMADDPASLLVLAGVVDQTSRYQADKETATQLQSLRDDRASMLGETGTQMRELITQIMTVARDTDDAEVGFLAGVTQQELMLGRLYAERFLLNSDQASFDRAQAHLEAAGVETRALIAALQSSPEVSTAQNASALLEEYTATFDATFDIITRRDQAYASMAAVGTAIVADIATLQDSLTQHQNQLGPAGATATRNSKIGVGAIAVLATIMSVLVALRIYRSLGQLIFKTVEDPMRRAGVFQERVEEVTGSALHGDFANRIPLEGLDDNQHRLGTTINDLMTTLEQTMDETVSVVECMSRGDLTSRLSTAHHGEFGRLASAINTTSQGIEEIVVQIQYATGNVEKISGSLLGDSAKMQRRAEGNASAIEEISAGTTEMAQGIQAVAYSVKKVTQESSEASTTARSGDTLAESAVASLAEISEATQEMERTVQVINDIAFQINLLALNAGVEAARAGDAGRGFAVVASEVRNLAQNSTDAVKQISRVISRSRETVDRGVEHVGQTREALISVLDRAENVTQRIEKIDVAMDGQARGLAEIKTALSDIDRSTQANVASFDEISVSSQTLSDRAVNLRDLVAQFTTSPAAGAAAQKLTARTAA